MVHYIPIKMAKIKKSDNTKCWWGWGETGSLTCCWWECKMVQPLWKTIWPFSKKLNIQIPYAPTVVFLDIYSREMKISVHRKTCTPMFITPLFLMTRTQKQPRCSSTFSEHVHCQSMWMIFIRLRSSFSFLFRLLRFLS